MLRVGSVTTIGVILLREEEIVVMTVELSVDVVPDSVALPGMLTDVVNTDGGLPVVSDWIVAVVSIISVVVVTSASNVLLTVCIILVVFTLIVVSSEMSSV